MKIIIIGGGTAGWSTGGTTTTPVTTQAAMTGTIVARGTSFFPSSRSFSTGNNFFFITEADRNSYVAQGLTTGLGITGSGIPAGTTISSIAFFGNIGGTTYFRVFMTQNANSNVTGDSNVTVTQVFRTTSTSTIFFQRSSWEASGARSGTEVNDPQFPAGTFVNSATLTTFFGTQYYNVAFNRTSIGTAMTPGTTQITFRFGAATYALPGETVFSFIASPGTNQSIDLTNLKELTNTTVGGRGTYPNGPDVLAINVYKASGAAVNSNIILRWGEAQA